MIRTIQRACILLAVLALPTGAHGQKRALTDAQWREDLRTLARELPKQHRSAFDPLRSHTTRERFDSAVARLDGRIPSLTDHEVIVGLASLVAMLGDGHTRLTLPQDTAVSYGREHTPTAPPNDSTLYVHHLPVQLDVYPEGVFVRAATPEYRELIGARVLEVGRTSADSALEAVRPVVHYDNEMGFRLLAPTYLVIPEVLHAVRVTDTPERTRLVVRDARGERREVTLAPLPLFRPAHFVEARYVAGAPVPVSERRLDDWYWLERIPASRALYVQVNRFGSREDESMLAFSRRIAAMVRDSSVDRLVLDLRHNPGGNAGIGRPLLEALAGSAVDRPGRLFVLTGRETFSAAQLFVNDLEHLTYAMFVGEPTGSAPSAFGDSRKFRLPNSGLTVRASIIYWRSSDGDEKRPWTEPHLPVQRTAADQFANRDPVLDSALAFRAPDDPAAFIRQVRGHAEWAPTMRLCWAFAADPRIPQARSEAGVAACGFQLLAEGQTATAAQWFQATLDYLPGSALAYYGLGQAQLRAGDRAKARAALENAVRLDPSMDPAKRLLAELRGTPAGAE
ncbi:MAG: tetratricopeptide repeat protein [Gemmatimonadetes bacterium]|nr:tetratricopeptide repeat protein [Gemmatimonadota bacterium]